METFPVQHSILDKKQIASFVKEKYGLNDIVHCTIIKTGINHTYLISHHSLSYIFRVYSYNWRTEIEINEELRIINLLKKENVPVSYPIQDLQKKFIQHINAPEGKRYGVLFSYAEGEKIRDLNEEACYNIGQLMANFHKTTLNKSCDRTSYNTKTLTEDSYNFISSLFSEPSDEIAFIKNAKTYVSSLFDAIDSKKVRSGIVHLDIWYDNMNIKNDSGITLFDFDFCGNGYFVLDIGYSIMQLFMIEPNKKQFQLKQKAFFNGYESITKISVQEKELTPKAGLAIWIFYLGIQAQRFDDHSNFFLTKNYLKHFLGMVKSWLAYNEINIVEN